MPPSPRSSTTRNVPASTSPTSGSSLAPSAASSEVASLGQTKKSAGYFAPHTEHRLVRTATMVGASLNGSGTLSLRLVGEVRTEPSLDLADAHGLAGGVIFDLTAVDLAHRKIARLGVPEVDAAHAGGGCHREALGQVDTDGAC